MQEEINAKNTMRSVRSEDAQLRQELRSPNDIHGHTANFAEPMLLQPPASLSYGPGPVSAGGGPLGEPGVRYGSGDAVDVQAPAPNAPTAEFTVPGNADRKGNYSCGGVCGHLRFDGPFKKYHNKHGNCNTTKAARRVVKYPKLSGAQKFGGRCLCEGTEEYPDGCRSAA